jgi:hypothetical protein
VSSGSQGGKYEDDSSGMRFEVLTANSMKMAVFWVVAPCGLVYKNTLQKGQNMTDYFSLPNTELITHPKE